MTQKMMRTVVIQKPYLSEIKYDGRYSYDEPQKIAQLFKVNGLCDMADEYVWVLCVDAKMHIVEFAEISHSGINWSLASPRNIFRQCILNNACGFIMIHNHPSGDVTPSADDIRNSKNLKTLGKFMEIYLVDHIIIASNGDYYSMEEHGDLVKEEN